MPWVPGKSTEPERWFKDNNGMAYLLADEGIIGVTIRKLVMTDQKQEMPYSSQIFRKVSTIFPFKIRHNWMMSLKIRIYQVMGHASKKAFSQQGIQPTRHSAKQTFSQPGIQPTRHSVNEAFSQRGVQATRRPSSEAFIKEVWYD